MPDRMIHVSRIDPHPDNPRESVGGVSELAASIRVHGIVEPLVACLSLAAPGRYLLIAGHRRLAAAKAAGLDMVPADIRPAPEEPVVVMLVENCQREDLTPVDKARAMSVLLGKGWTAARICRETGLSSATVSATLAMLELDQSTQERVRAGRVRASDALAAVRSTRAQRRQDHGAAPRKVSVAAEHFTAAHPLAEDARVACELAGHGGRKVGRNSGFPGACGECWEDAIRRDERGRRTPAQPPAGSIFLPPVPAGSRA